MFAGLVLSGPAAAGTLEGGEADYRRGGVSRALFEWRSGRRRGPGGQFKIRNVFGHRVASRYVEAVKRCRRAPEEGRLGPLMLGTCGQGQGVPQHFAEAFKRYRKAADQHPVRQGNLGKCTSRMRRAREYVQAHLYWNLAASRLPASG